MIRTARWTYTSDRNTAEVRPLAGRSSGVGKPQLALTKHWWVTLRDRDPVRFALAKAARKQWLPQVQRRLDEFKEDGQGPGSWQRLADLLDIDPATLFRWRGSKDARNAPSLRLQDLESFASILRLSVHALVPEPACQLAWAVEYLCRRSVSLEEARAYSVYCHSVPASHWEANGDWEGELIRSALTAVVESEVYSREADASTAIWRVAEQMEPVLLAVWLQST